MCSSPNPTFTAFVRAGTKPVSRSHKQPTSVLSCANDWQFQCDYKDNPVIFPPVITATSLRPDLVIWSEAAKTVVIMELTVPSEDNVADAAFRKTDKYQSLVADCSLNNWKVVFQTVEVGCRGFSFRKYLLLLGCPNSTIKLASSRASRTALRCSYAIYLARNNPSWQPLQLLHD